MSPLAPALIATMAVAAAPEPAPEAELDGTSTSSAAEEDSWLDDWVLLPVVFYTPETRLGFGGMVIYTFDCVGNDSERNDRRSGAQFRAFYTLEKQTSIFLQPNLWMFGDFLSVVGSFEFRNYPFKYFGRGNDPDLSVFDVYTERVFEARPQVTFRIDGGLRAGLNLHFFGGDIIDYPTDGLLARDGAVGLDSIVTWGLGPMISWDTRDSNFWPKRGRLLNVDLTFFSEALGSDYSFTRFTADMASYHELWLGHVLALHGYVRLSDGEVPFTLLPNLGGTSRHRGWFFGALRDQHVYLAQVEYRAPIWWRFGLTAFASLGQTMAQLDDVNFGELQPAVGAGIRFRLNDEGFNIRIDYAYGGQSEFYFQVGEAF